MGLMGLVGLTNSCSNDEEPAKGQAEASEAPVAEVRSFATYFDEYVAKTRAWTPPTDGDVTYTTYEDGTQSIGIAFTQDGNKAIMGSLYKNGEQWRLIVTDPERSVDEITTGDYYLYGYIPNTPGVVFNVTDLSGYNGVDASYHTGAKVVLTNVPTVMSKDLCVTIGAKHGTGKEVVTGLHRGDFKFSAEQTSNDNPKNFVFLLFDHLYAALSINMKVHGDYAALRTIKLKSLKLNTKASDGETGKEYTTITASLRANNTGSDPIEDVSYVQTGNTVTEGLSFWSSDAGVTLNTDFQLQPFTGHFMPSGITTLVLTSEYDVYDTKGNLTREGCKATNTMVLSDLLTGQTTTKRGNRYTVNLTIQPTYLYVLSDPDLDSPTVTVE